MEVLILGSELDQVASEESLMNSFDTAVSKTGRLDILVNNAQQHHIEDWETATAKTFEDQARNGTAYFLLARMLRNHVVAGKKKRVCCNVRIHERRRRLLSGCIRRSLSGQSGFLSSIERRHRSSDATPC